MANIMNKNQDYKVEVILNKDDKKTLDSIISISKNELDFNGLMVDYLVKFNNEYFTVLEINKENKTLTLVSDEIN